MKASKGRVAPSKRAAWAIERWAVERVDRDAGMARIESVPMHSSRITAERVKSLEAQGLEKELDHLDLWDVNSIRIRRMSLATLRRILGVRSDEKEVLSENMVFWLMHRGDAKKPEHVFHATIAARKSAKDLYVAVATKQRRSL